ncbi:MAG: tetratricopeptide repeat protein [Acidobacteriota bacterium]|nr:tetratricopeptide repeat protein [Acidobacteriota bacterium]
MRGCTHLVVAVAVVLGSASGVVASQETTTEPTLTAVELPDLARMHASVQAQLREAYAAMYALETEESPELSAEHRARRSEAYGQVGKLLLAGDYPAAADSFLQNARALAPTEFRWPYYLAHTSIRKGHLDQAVDYLEQALLLDGDDFAALVWLVHVHVELDQPEAAAPVLAKATSLYPDAQALLYEGGRTALAAQNYAGAVEQLEAALQLNDGATVIHYPLAMAYRGLGNLDQARYHLGRSRNRTGGGHAAGAAVTVPDPLMAEVYVALRSPQAHRDLGLQASERGDWLEAIRQFRQAIELAPDNSAMQVNLGTALIQTGNARAAIAALETAVGLDPRLARAHFLLATVLERGGRDQDAIDRYRAAVMYDADFTAASLRLADALRRTGAVDASLPHYQRAIVFQEARFGEVMALVRLGRHQEALARLQTAIELHPEQPAFSHALARLLASAPDDAVRNGPRSLELVEALAQQYKTAAVAETMAMALAETGRFAEAVEWQRFAMGIATDAALPGVARGMASNLTRYLQNEPCRTPWRDDEPEHNPGPQVDPTLLGPVP